MAVALATGSSGSPARSAGAAGVPVSPPLAATSTVPTPGDPSGGRDAAGATTPATTPGPASAGGAAPGGTGGPASPGTTAAPPAPQPVPSTHPASPQQALDAIVEGLGPTYAVSPIAGQDRSMYVAIDHPAAQAGGGSLVVVDVYQWLDGAWKPLASVPLGGDGSTGLLLPASQDATPITVAAVTGSALPDYIVTTASASALISTVVSDTTGRWRAVPFETPAGSVDGVPDAVVRADTITATFDACTPTCATGGDQQVTYTYQHGSFVPHAG